jgi:3-hydroxyisobutyrate dehydrogenase-like beta-hydroxyacid dehydrogenase
MKIAFLGLGEMGREIAGLLVKQGLDVTVWNRTAAAAEELVAAGAKGAESAAEAVKEADVVFTMLFDDAAVEDVLLNGGVLDAMKRGAVHVSLATISVELAERLEGEHARGGLRELGSPVFGRPEVAAAGKLWLAVAGEASVIEEVQPVLQVFSRGLTVVGDRPSRANVAKLAGNFMISSAIGAMAEAFTVTKALGIAPEIFLEMMNSALYQSAFVGTYGKLMLDPPEKVGATVKLGAKDTRLFQEAAETGGVATPLAEVYREGLEAAIAAGNGDADWASGYYAQVKGDS